MRNETKQELLRHYASKGVNTYEQLDAFTGCEADCIATPDADGVAMQRGCEGAPLRGSSRAHPDTRRDCSRRRRAGAAQAAGMVRERSECNRDRG
jgi:hypothetical protein